MRKENIREIETFIKDNNLQPLSNQLYALCMHIYSSGWVSGNNDDWEDEGDYD